MASRIGDPGGKKLSTGTLRFGTSRVRHSVVRSPESQLPAPAMTLLTVRHVTTYRYRQPVSFGEHRMMFRPRDSYDQKLLEARLEITPEPQRALGARRVRQLRHDRGVRRGGADELRFESNIWLDHSPSNTPDFQIEDYAKTYPFSYAPEEMPDLAPRDSAAVSRPGRRGRPLGAALPAHGRRTDTGMLLMTLTYAFKESFTYERRSEPGTQPPRADAKLGRGSCRDLALLMIEALRSLGFAARFVSGYLYVPEPRRRRAIAAAARRTPGARSTCRAPAGSSSTPPMRIVGNRDLIRVAVARDPSQAIPLSGTYFGAADDFREMTVEVQGALGRRQAREPAASRRASATRYRRRPGRLGIATSRMASILLNFAPGTRDDCCRERHACRSAPATRSPTNARSRRRCC